MLIAQIKYVHTNLLASFSGDNNIIQAGLNFYCISQHEDRLASDRAFIRDWLLSQFQDFKNF